MKAKDVLRKLQARMEEVGSQKALADEIGVSQPYLSDVLKGKRDPGPSILSHLGLKKSAVYEEEK